MKFKFKPKLVPIFIHYFILFLGLNFFSPFLMLQMRTLGLTLTDASLVTGFGKLIAGVFTPMFGYIGDKLGYKSVLIFTLIGLIATSTSLNFLPIYREYSAKIGLDKSMYDDTWKNFDSKSILWFGKYEDLNSSCEYEAQENIIKEIECEDKVFNVDIVFNKEDIDNSLAANCTDLGIQTCKYFVQEINDQEILICNVRFEKLNGNFKKGSHSLTLWVYFSIRTLLFVFVNVMWNVSDAAASTITITEGSSYGMVIFFANIGGVISAFVAGPIVDNFSFGTDYWDCLTDSLVTVNDFKVPFFINNACYVAIIIIVFFFLDVEKTQKKPEKKISLKKEFKWLLNPAPIGFFIAVFVAGMSSDGAAMTYSFIFAQETLGASTTFLGYMMITSTVCNFPALAIAKYAIKYLGHINTICLFQILFMSRLIGYGFTYSSPPYPFIAYAAMDSFFNIYMVAGISYSSVIAPQSLIATAISIGSVLCYVFGGGVGSLLAGVLVDRYNMRVMFIIFGIGGCSFFLVYWILYHLIIKRFEVDQNKDKDADTSENHEQKNWKEENNGINLTARIMSTRL